MTAYQTHVRMEPIVVTGLIVMSVHAWQDGLEIFVNLVSLYFMMCFSCKSLINVDIPKQFTSKFEEVSGAFLQLLKWWMHSDASRVLAISLHDIERC